MPHNSNIAPVKRRFYLTFTIIGAVILLIGIFYVVGQIWTPISIILVSSLLVFILRTPVAFLEKKGVPRPLGAAISYVLALVILGAILLILIPVAVEQLVSFLSMVPEYVKNAGAWLEGTFDEIAQYLDESGIQNVVATVTTELAKWAADMASSSANAIVGTATTIGNVFLVAGVSIIVGFWVLMDLPRFGKEIHNIVGPKYEEDLQVISGALSRSLGGYLRGMVVSCLCVGTMTFIFYSLIGMPYPLVMALFTGLMVFIPFIGPAIAWILAGVVGLLMSPLTGLLAVVLTIAAQMINDNLISPRVMGGAVELHPAVILVVLFIGAALGGIFGMLCAIPLTGAVKTIFVYYFEKRTGRQLVSAEGALFKGRPAKSTNPLEDASEGILAGKDKVASFINDKVLDRGKDKSNDTNDEK